MTSYKFNFNGYFIIALTNPSEDSQNTIKKILSCCWKLYIANVVILIPTQNYDKILLYTFFPYSEEHCEQVKPILYNYFQNNSFELSLPHFPQKFMNFHQCPLLFSTNHNPPYMILSDGVNGTNYPDGIESIFLRELSKRLNFDTVVLRTESTHQTTQLVIVF